MENPITTVVVKNLTLVKSIINTTRIDDIEVYKDSTYVGVFDIDLTFNCHGVNFIIKQKDVEFKYDHPGLFSASDWKRVITDNIVDNIKRLFE